MKIIRIDSVGAYVVLTRGVEARIDASDVALVSQHSWHATTSSTGCFYARSSRVGFMHRLLTGAKRGEEVDHINHDTLDNRRENLRVGTHKQNMENGKFALATHCPAGHPYDEANTYRDKKGRRCRACNAARVAAIYANETAEQREARRQRTKAYNERTRETRIVKQAEYAETHKQEKREYDLRRRQTLASELAARRAAKRAGETPELREKRLAVKRASYHRRKESVHAKTTVSIV